MKSSRLFLLSWLLVTAVSHAQAPATVWKRTYGEYRAAGYAVIETSDSCFCIVGYTADSSENRDLCLLKLNPDGEVLFLKTYGGALRDYGWSVKQTSDAGYIIVGETKSYGAGNYDAWLIKTDANGDTMWTRTYGGVDSDGASSIQQTLDSGYIFVGRTESFGAGEGDIYLIKTDQYGDTLWTRTYGGTEREYGATIQQTSDKGYIIAGGTKSYGLGSYDVFLVKLDSLGDTLWTKTYGGAEDDIGLWGLQTCDNGYIITGATYSFTPVEGDVYLIRTDSLGDTLWTRHWGDDNLDHGYCIIPTSDSTFVITGSTYDVVTNLSDVLLIKVNLSGDTLWTTAYGAYDSDEWGNCVCQASDRSYVIVGERNRDHIYVVKTQPDIEDQANDVGVEEDNIAARLDHFGATIFSGSLHLPEGKTCRVFDITGSVVASDKLRPGIYFIEVEDKITQKVVKIR